MHEQVCDAVAAVHNCGFAHRDVKPHNVLLEQRTLRDSAALTLSEEDSPSIAMLSTIPEGSQEEFERDDSQVVDSDFELDITSLLDNECQLHFSS